MFVAIINTPGYLPESEPVEFDTAAEAWQYLTEERGNHEEQFGEAGDQFSPTWHALDSHPDEAGTIYGPTPGTDSPHDLGLAYSVEFKPDYPDTWFINVYEASRAYGGPEEGGWWYDTGRFITGRTAHSEADAQATAESLRSEYPHTGRRGSVLGGEDYEILIERHTGRDYPDTIPHYE